MAMILDAFIGRCCTLLTDLGDEEFIMVLGVKDELQKLLRKIKSIRFLLNDAEKRKIDKESPIQSWLSELKDVMYEVDDIIDLCSIKGAQLLADQNSKSEPSSVCCKFSFNIFSCFTSAPLRHELGNKIKEVNIRLNQIYENSDQLKLEKSEISKTPQISPVNSLQTSSMIEPLVVGGYLEVATNLLVNLLTVEKAEEICRVFAVAGMGGIGKTTLAQKIFNHQKIEASFTSKVWVSVSQPYNETELLKRVIIGLNGSYGDAYTTSELVPILRDSVASYHSLFLVLDDVWRADIWLHHFRIPLLTSNSRVRVLVTTRDENVAKVMRAAHIYHVMGLSIDASWDMLRRLLFKVEHEEQLLADDLKELGLKILEKCGGLPLAIKAIAGVLGTREKTRTAWEQILRSDTWSAREIHEDYIASALHLCFEDLPSHLKQCFLYLSLYGEDDYLNSREFARLWVAEGFLSENQENSLMEDVAESYFNELLGRNLLLPGYSYHGRTVCRMHDIFRSLAIFLSREETSCGDMNVKNPSIFTKLRRLSVAYYKSGEATEIFDLVAKKGTLRTLLAKYSDLLLDDKRLRWLSCLRVLDISSTEMEQLPDSIGNLVHLRYLDLSRTKIKAIPESIKHLAYLQFLNLKDCNMLQRLPYGITQLHNLRYLNLRWTDIRFMPKGIEKLQQLNCLRGFPVANDDSSSKLEELNSLKQLRSLQITNIKGAQSDVILFKELPHLSNLTLDFFDHEGATEEQRLAVELFDKIIPPRSLKKLKVRYFSGPRFPNWMASLENHVPNLTILELWHIKSCTQLPPLGQLPELRELEICAAKKVKQIGQEFLGGGVNSTTRVAFPRLEKFFISYMDELEDWSFGAQVEENASPRLKLLPCLHTLEILNFNLLKQLPKGLKHSAMKSLIIEGAEELKSLDDLPPEIEELELRNNLNLEKVCCLAMLKKLNISYCPTLTLVEKLDSLQSLKFENESMDGLPDWLLIFLQQWELKDDTNEDFFLDLSCSRRVFQECIKEGSYWDLIQHIPQVTIYDSDGRYLRYDKKLGVYHHEVKTSD